MVLKPVSGIESKQESEEENVFDENEKAKPPANKR
jgi:hypothetical protein